MRRKMLVSVCAAVVLVMAICSTSFATVTLDGPSSVTAGGTVEFRIHSTEKGMSANITTTGLEFQSVQGGLSDKDMVLLLEDYGGMDATYTYTVTATSGQEVSFDLSDVRESDGVADTLGPSVTWSGTVGGTATTTQGPMPSRTNPPLPTSTPVGSANAGTSTVPTGTLTGSALPTNTALPAPVATVTASGDAAVVSAEPTPVPTTGPRTGDTSVSIWVWIAIGAACVVIGIIAARKLAAAKRQQ